MDVLWHSDGDGDYWAEMEFNQEPLENCYEIGDEIGR